MKNTIQFGKNEKIRSICYDKAFKAVFTQDTKESNFALKSLLSGIICKEIEAVKLSNNEPSPKSENDKQIRYDISCKLNSGELVDVEMTFHPSAAEICRMEYYLARLLTGQKIVGEAYDKLKHTYHISFIVNSAIIDDERFMHHLMYNDIEIPLQIETKSHIIIVELKKLAHIAEEKPVGEMTKQEMWALFFRYCEDKSKRNLINGILKSEEGIAMAGEELVKFTQREIDWFKNEAIYKQKTDALAYEAELRDRDERNRMEERKKILELMRKEYSADIADAIEKKLLDNK
jgi:predicted transposase/invertase (TIGR01784 family)